MHETLISTVLMGPDGGPGCKMKKRKICGNAVRGVGGVEAAGRFDIRSHWGHSVVQ